MSIDQKFEDAQKRVNGLPSAPDSSTLLELYGLYKQATLGDASGSRPGIFDIKGRAKFDAWSSRKGMAKDAAKEAYVKLVDRLTAK